MISIPSRIHNILPRIRFRKVGDEGVVISMQDGRVLVVNEIGLYILDQIKQKREFDEIVGSITSEYDVNADQARADVLHYLDVLTEEKVITPQCQPNDQ